MKGLWTALKVAVLVARALGLGHPTRVLADDDAGWNATPAPSQK